MPVPIASPLIFDDVEMGTLCFAHPTHYLHKVRWALPALQLLGS